MAGWAAHKTAHIKLTISLQGMGMGGPAEHFQTNANRSLTLTTLPGVGAIREGSNGKVLWAQDPINGLRVLEGAEAEQARIEAAWNTDLQAHELFPKIETAIDSPAGLECLTMTPKVGRRNPQLLRRPDTPSSITRRNARNRPRGRPFSLLCERLGVRWAG